MKPKKLKQREESGKKQEPLSLHPLTPEEALKKAMGVSSKPQGDQDVDGRKKIGDNSS